MEYQDTKLNYKIITTALIAVIIAILIAFYYSYAQSKTSLKYLEDQKDLLVKDVTLMKVEVNRLSGLNEINDLELRTSRTRVQMLLDSVGRLNFSITKLKENRKTLRNLELQFDSLKVKNNFLRYNNNLITEKYEKTKKEIQELRGKTSSLEQAEALVRQKNLELSNELKVKSYLQIADNSAEGNAFRLRGGRPIETNKASIVEKLRGCVTILANPNEKEKTKVLYLQFMDPNMKIIEDNTKTVSVGGNIYSKRSEVLYLGKEIQICDAITVPKGSLQDGVYTLNVFEDERLLTSTEFQLK